jgi:predicted membrane protein
MEPYNKNQETKISKLEKIKSPSGRFWAGGIIIAVGAVLLAREVGADIPRWLVSGPTLLIAIGLFIGARSSFKNWAWLIFVGVGSALLVDRIFWDINLRPYIWPSVIIAIGLFMILRPKGKRGDSENWTNFDFSRPQGDSATTTTSTSTNGEEDIIDIVSIFGSAKKNILSKNFKGGEVVNFFGGSEINLHQADINGPVLLDMTQVFGGAKLIVPSNWRIQSELVSVFGGVDDKRMAHANIDPNKVLVLKGTCVFGGLEIKSY